MGKVNESQEFQYAVVLMTWKQDGLGGRLMNWCNIASDAGITSPTYGALGSNPKTEITDTKDWDEFPYEGGYL